MTTVHLEGYQETAILGAAIRLYRARVAQKATLQAMRDYGAAHGRCEFMEQARRPGEAQAAPCYYDDSYVNGELFSRPRVQWCSVCTGRQPLWEARQAAAQEAGAAFTAFKRVCKQAGL